MIYPVDKNVEKPVTRTTFRSFFFILIAVTFRIDKEKKVRSIGKALINDVYFMGDKKNELLLTHPQIVRNVFTNKLNMSVDLI